MEQSAPSYLFGIYSSICFIIRSFSSGEVPMNRYRQSYLYFIAAVFLVLSFAIMSLGNFAVPAVEAAPLAADTPTSQPTLPTATNTPVPPTATNTSVPPTATNTSVPPTATEPGPTETLQPPQTVTPPPTPVPPAEIPEPITVVLFGTGLAALSAAAASRRNKKAE
ncbi:MAG: PEP-CTERM sorting domain-containing protein [Chloroflexota bacterium]|jgi:hypothetical protein|nr:PEP-CTERM sorting domain-containing protein [Chloroflexota bacterium]